VSRAYSTSGDIRSVLRHRLGYSFKQKHLAKELGVSVAYLSDYLAGNREVGPTILKAMGYSILPHYRKAAP